MTVTLSLRNGCSRIVFRKYFSRRIFDSTREKHSTTSPDFTTSFHTLSKQRNAKGSTDVKSEGHIYHSASRYKSMVAEANFFTEKDGKHGILHNHVEECNFDLIESIPTGMEFPNFQTSNKSTFAVWKELLKNAERSIDIVAFYWTLRDKTNYETSWQGAEIFNDLISAAQRNVKLRIVQHAPDNKFFQEDSAYLAKNGLAEVRNLDMRRFGTGVLHTKMWIVDSKHIYVGSANMDWRSLTEVKELGVVLRNCPVIADDLQKVFAVYWQLAASNNIPLPRKWSDDLKTNINRKNPLNIICTDDANKNNQKVPSPRVDNRIFIASSPPTFNPTGREDDISAVLSVIHNASSFIRISVMEYLPATVFLRNKNFYWPEIDNALRAAAFRGVNVELLISHWRYSKKEVMAHLKSLLQFNEGLVRRGRPIKIKIHRVPSDEKQEAIDHARVNHSKMMVTDKAAYIGTSNWSGDYFLYTGGVGVVFEAINSPVIIEKFNQVFIRDWESQYATPLEL